MGKRPLLVPLMLLSTTGCLAPVTRRLDVANQELTASRALLVESNQRLGDAQAKLAETNQRVAHLETQLDETNRRVGTVDQALIKLFPGLPKP